MVEIRDGDVFEPVDFCVAMINYQRVTDKHGGSLEHILASDFAAVYRRPD